jgi:hypothetical protein
VPHGLIVRNQSQNVLIDDVLPVLVEARRGVMSSDGLVANFGGSGYVGAYTYQPSGGAIVGPDEILGFVPNIGDWVTWNAFSDPNFGGGPSNGEGIFVLRRYCSNAPSLPYVVFKTRSFMPAPTGYGMAAFNASGQCVWDAESLIFSVKEFGVITGADSSSKFFASQPVTAGNCIFGDEGSFSWWQTQSEANFMSARRTHQDTYIFERRAVTRESGGSGSGNFQNFPRDFRYMIGKVQE